MIEENGSFRKLFEQHHRSIIKQAELGKRTLFILDNPTMPDNTAEIDTSWWLELEE